MLTIDMDILLWRCHLTGNHFALARTADARDGAYSLGVIAVRTLIVSATARHAGGATSVNFGASRLGGRWRAAGRGPASFGRPKTARPPPRGGRRCHLLGELLRLPPSGRPRAGGGRRCEDGRPPHQRPRRRRGLDWHQTLAQRRQGGRHLGGSGRPKADAVVAGARPWRHAVCAQGCGMAGQGAEATETQLRRGGAAAGVEGAAAERPWRGWVGSRSQRRRRQLPPGGVFGSIGSRGLREWRTHHCLSSCQ